MSNPDRPLSPHLQIYRRQLSAVTSVLHRASGLILAIGALLIAWWFWAAMSGAASYQSASGFLTSIFGWLLLFVWTLCMFYHLCNGIRHLLWDAGYCMEMEQANLAGKIAIGAAGILTILAFLL